MNLQLVEKKVLEQLTKMGVLQKHFRGLQESVSERHVFGQQGRGGLHTTVSYTSSSKESLDDVYETVVMSTPRQSICRLVYETKDGHSITTKVERQEDLKGVVTPGKMKFVVTLEPDFVFDPLCLTLRGRGGPNAMVDRMGGAGVDVSDQSASFLEVVLSSGDDVVKIGKKKNDEEKQMVELVLDIKQGADTGPDIGGIVVAQMANIGVSEEHLGVPTVSYTSSKESLDDVYETVVMAFDGKEKEPQPSTCRLVYETKDGMSTTTKVGGPEDLDDAVFPGKMKFVFKLEPDSVFDPKTMKFVFKLEPDFVFDPKTAGASAGE